MTPKDGTTALTAPANSIHLYQTHIKNIDVALPHEHTDPVIYKVGDTVWVKTQHGQYST